MNKKSIKATFAKNGTFDKFMSQLAEEGKFSGVVLVAENDEILFENAYGIADRSRNQVNNVNTKFNLGSCNKMFTVTAIMQLAEQEKLKISDTIDKYVDAFLYETASKITIEQLLTHTSGIGDLFTPEYMAHKDEVGTINEFMSYITSQPLCFEPGERYEYSNGGFVVLGAIIEKVSGESYYGYIRKHITRPLGMNDTEFYKKFDDVPNLAHGYIDSLFLLEDKADPLYPFYCKNAERKDNEWFLGLIGQPSGGGYSTARDMLKFSSALCNHTLLSKEFTRLMITGKVDTPYGFKYGYGFVETMVHGHRVIGHSGGGPGIAVDFDVLMDDGYTVVTFSNHDGGEQKPREPREKMLRLILGVE